MSQTDSDLDYFREDQQSFFAGLFSHEDELARVVHQANQIMASEGVPSTNQIAMEAQAVLDQAQSHALPADYSVFMDTGCYQMFVQMVALAAHDLIGEGREREEAIAWIYGTSEAAIPLKLLCEMVEMPEHIQDSLQAALLDHPKEIIAACTALNRAWSLSGTMDPSAFQRYFTGDAPSWYAEDRLAEMASDWAMTA